MKTKVFAVELLAASMIITACSSAGVPSEAKAPETTAVVTTETTSDPTPTPEPTPTPVVYSFSWSADDSRNFATYFEQTTGYPNMRGYIQYFGFTVELNKILTEYINNKYDTDYESVPFSEVSYFHTYMVDKEVEARRYRNNSETFAKVCLHPEQSPKGPLINKLVMSYLYQNQIPVGQRIPYENLKALGLEDIHSFSGVGYIYDNGYLDLGNYDSSYEYSNYELFAILEAYNTQLWKICNDERIKNLDILTDDPEFPQAAEAREIYNGFLREYYGFDNCPQFGEVVTREQYIEIFGEEPLDLSYIPGAVVN